jgi:hypothetical protein
VDTLKRLARSPLKVMDALLAEAAAVAAAPDLPWEAKAERLRAKQAACLQEVEASYAAFREAAAAAETKLREALGAPGRSTLAAARRCAEELRRLVKEVRARETFLQAWEQGSPAEFLRAYREATARRDRERVALLEACGERIARRLGDRAVLQSFRELKRQRQAREGTPEERAAVRFLDVLRDLRREAEVLYGLPGLRRGDGPAPR